MASRDVNWAMEHALTRREYDILKEDTKSNLEGDMMMECLFVLITIGELGLRAGELSHITREGPHDWIDLINFEIRIPEYSPCDCGYCRQQAKQKADRDDLYVDEVLQDWWRPINEASVRTVPFHYSDELIEFYKRFFEMYSGWNLSRSSVNRRIDRMVENSTIDRDPSSVAPQTLRVTAANYHAKKGMNPKALTEMMGFADERTALKFVGSNSIGIRGELSRIHGCL